MPYYMTLSCNIKGLRALLAGSFFDPDTPCNLVGPWMQLAFEVIDPLLDRGDSIGLAAVLARRQPVLAAMWLGAIVLQLEESILRSIQAGLNSIEVHAAAWTGTNHSFLTIAPQLPSSTE